MAHSSIVITQSRNQLISGFSILLEHWGRRRSLLVAKRILHESARKQKNELRSSWWLYFRNTESITELKLVGLRLSRGRMHWLMIHWSKRCFSGWFRTSGLVSISRSRNFEANLLDIKSSSRARGMFWTNIISCKNMRMLDDECPPIHHFALGYKK